MSVLVVEDDADSREMLCELLSSFGVECDTAPDVATAREKLSVEARAFDLVISDIGLPDEDGYALSRWVQKRPCPPRRPPLIAFTATNDRDAAKAAGFAAHVMKPVDIVRLVEAMASALTSKDAKAAPAKA